MEFDYSGFIILSGFVGPMTLQATCFLAPPEPLPSAKVDIFLAFRKESNVELLTLGRIRFGVASLAVFWFPVEVRGGVALGQWLLCLMFC